MEWKKAQTFCEWISDSKIQHNFRKNEFLSLSSNSPIFYRVEGPDGRLWGSARAVLLRFPIKWNQTRSGRNERRDSCTRDSP